MFKLKFTILTLIMFLAFGAQANAKEIKPLFGIYKIVSNEADEFLSQSWTRIYLTDEAEKAYPKLGKAIDQYGKELHEKAMERDRKYHEEALTFKQEAPEAFHPFYDKTDIIVRRSDSVVLSLLEMSEDYMGGVHGMYGYFGVNFDSETGKQLQISDVCTNAEDLLREIMTRLHEDAPQSPFEDAEEKIMKRIVEDNLNFTIEPAGVSFYFNPYEIGSYAEGLFTATLLFSEYPDLFKSKYKQLSKAYCQTLSLYNADIMSFKDGMRNYIHVSIDDDGFYQILTGSGTAEDKTGLSGIKPPVLVHLANGNNYLYVDGYIENKGRSLHVYNISESKIELTGVLPYTFKNLGTLKYETWWIPTDPNNIQFDSLEPVGNKNLTSHNGAINNDGSFSFG